MSRYLGDYPAGATLDVLFTSTAPTGTPAALAGGVVSVYKGNNPAQATAGVTLTANFDGVTGLNQTRVALTDSFYAGGFDYAVVLTAGTVGSTDVSGYVLAEFSIGNRSAATGAALSAGLSSVSLAATGLDAIAAAAPANRAAATTFPKLLMLAVRTLLNTRTRNKATGSQTTYADDDATPLLAQTSTDDGTTQRVTKAL